MAVSEETAEAEATAATTTKITDTSVFEDSTNTNNNRHSSSSSNNDNRSRTHMYLVEGLREVRVERLPVRDSLADDPTHELEVRQVLSVNVGHRVGLEGSPVRSGDEQGVILVEDVPRQDGVPVGARAPSI